MNMVGNSISLAKKTRLRLTLLVGILFLSSITSLWILHEIEETNKHEAHIVNEAGKLRSLDLRVMNLLNLPPSSDMTPELKKVQSDIKRIQIALQQAHGEAFRQLIKDLYVSSPSALNERLNSAVVKAIVFKERDTPSSEVSRLKVELESLFNELDSAVTQIENFIIDRNISTSNIITFLILLSFLLTLLVITCIFMPVDRALSKYARDTNRLLAIVGSVTECIKSVNKDFTLKSMNSAGLDLVGVNCISKIKGMSVLDLITPEYHEHFKDAVNRVFEGETVDLEFEIISLDGTRRWMHQMATPYRDPESGNITEMVAVTRDISKKKEHADTLAKIQRNEVTNSLSSGIAHDINNILAIVSGNQQLLSIKNKDESLSPYIEKIQSAVTRASNLTTKLLKTSKESPSKMEMVTLEELYDDLNPLLQEAITNNITLEWDNNYDIKEKINKYDLEDAILNLVLNARNAITHHGTISLRTTIENTVNQHEDYFAVTPRKASKYIKFVVKDNGIGIPRDKFEDIFLPFKTFTKTGSGLGLSMVYGFANRCGYGLSLSSKVNEGTSFSIWIPISEQSYSASTSTNISSLGFNQYTRSLTIVLVDDEVDVLSVNKKLLEDNGHSVIDFASAQDAMKYLDNAAQPVDIIITDEVMPGEIQGHDLIHRYQHSYPIILVTGFSKTKNTRGLENMILHKPFSINALLEKINTAIKTNAAA